MGQQREKGKKTKKFVANYSRWPNVCLDIVLSLTSETKSFLFVANYSRWPNVCLDIVLSLTSETKSFFFLKNEF